MGYQVVQTLVHHGSAVDPNGSAQTSGRPLANPPGRLCSQTQADLLWSQPESITDPKIHHESAANQPQVCGRAMDLFVINKTKKVPQSASAPNQFSADFLFWWPIFCGQESDCLQQIHCSFTADFRVHSKNRQKILTNNSPLKKFTQEVHFF